MTKTPVKKAHQQFAVRTGSLRKIMASRDFNLGVADGRIGAPWPKGIDVAWDYERGRLFGALHPNVVVKVGRTVTEQAYRLAAIAVMERAIT